MQSRAPIANRDDLVDALCQAAAIEHGVICSYLFAAFSMKAHVDEGGVSAVQMELVRRWRGIVLRVAREEMEHLGLVCNMLTAVGAMPHLTPPHLLLEPFSETALGTFIRLEREHTAVDSGDSIGAKYARIRDGFSEVSRQNVLLFVGAPEFQVDNAALDLPPGWYDFDLIKVTDLPSARAAIDRILETNVDEPKGRNPDESASHSDAESKTYGHAELFETVLTELSGERNSDPEFEPSRPVARNPTMNGNPGTSGAQLQLEKREDGSVIENEGARRIATLFNAAYETMLVMLVRFYAPGGESESARAGLQKLAFFPLMTMVLRPLGEILTQLPIGPGTALRAGPTFELRGNLILPPHFPSASMVIGERLGGLTSACGALVEDGILDELDSAVQRRLAFIHENVARIEANYSRFVGAGPERMSLILQKLL